MNKAESTVGDSTGLNPFRQRACPACNHFCHLPVQIGIYPQGYIGMNIVLSTLSIFNSMNFTTCKQEWLCVYRFATVVVGSDSSCRLMLDKLSKREIHGQTLVVTHATRQALKQFDTQPRKDNQPNGRYTIYSTDFCPE